MITNPDLANTYEILAKDGISTFYEGEIAQDIINAIQSDPYNPGVMSLNDLQNYKPVHREPLSFNYKCRRNDVFIINTYLAHTFFGMNLPTSGTVTLALIMGILENLDLSEGYGTTHSLMNVFNAMKFITFLFC